MFEFTREFVTAGDTTRVTIAHDRNGWEVREERNNTLVKQVRYTDWHRVERAIDAFERSRPPAAAGRDN
jgi:hypothetical protein